MPRRSNNRRPAAPAAETRLQKAKKAAAAVASNGYVQFAAATVATSGLMLVTGHADVTVLQAAGTTTLSAAAVGAIVAVAKTAKAAYNNATVENIKALPGKAIAVPAAGLGYAKSGLSWAWSKVPAIRQQAAPAAEAPAAEERAPARRRSNRRK